VAVEAQHHLIERRPDCRRGLARPLEGKAILRDIAQLAALQIALLCDLDRDADGPRSERG
jgi:hypothetical protein